MHAFFVLLLASIATLTGIAAGAQDRIPAWPGRDWPAASPEAVGMSSSGLARLVEFGRFNDFDSVLIVRHGHLVLDASYGPFRSGLKHRLNSATKSVVASLVAIALAEGRLAGIDQRIVELLGEPPIGNLDDDKRSITVRHLLDMTSGLEWPEPFDGLPRAVAAMERSPDWRRHVLDQPMAGAPGTRFNYSSGDSHLLSAVLTHVTGRSALDYAREVLFGPLGIEDVVWRHDPQGLSIGGYGLYLRPHDMARLGYLYLRDGLWQGRRLLPSAWVDGIRRADIALPQSWAASLRYGRQFWVVPGRDAYMMVGFDRQLIVVWPRLDIVVVATGSARFPSAGGPPSMPRYSLDSLLGFVAAAVRSEAPLPPDPAGATELAQSLAAAAHAAPAPPGAPAPPLAAAPSGRTWRFAANPLALQTLTLRLDGASPSYAYTLARGEPDGAPESFGGPLGFDGQWQVGGRRAYGPSAARAAWTADGRLVIEVQSLGNDDAQRVTHVFRDDAIELQIETALGRRWILHGRRME